MPSNELPLKTRSIFLCYRQEDSSDVTGRIFDRLNFEFPDEVFMDMVIPFGVDFRGYIKEVLCRCKVVLVVVGPRWTNIQDSSGVVRLTDKEDCVRFEIETALSQPGLVVIPVAVGGDGFPDKKEVESLPETLRPLFKLNGPEIRGGRDFPHTMAELISSIEQALKREPQEITQPCPEQEPPLPAASSPSEDDAPISETAEGTESGSLAESAPCPPCVETAAAEVSSQPAPIEDEAVAAPEPSCPEQPGTAKDLPPQEEPAVTAPAIGTDETHGHISGARSVKPTPAGRAATAWIITGLLALLVVSAALWWFKKEQERHDEEQRLKTELAQKLAQKVDGIARDKAAAEAALQAIQKEVERLAWEKRASDDKLKAAEAEKKRLEKANADTLAQAEADRRAKKLAEDDRAAAEKLMAALRAVEDAEKIRRAAAEAEQKQKEWPKGASTAQPFKNSLSMLFVATSRPDLLFSIHPTQLSNFRTFVTATGYDAVNESPNGKKAHSVQRDGDEFQWQQMGASWKDSDFPKAARQTENHPVVCVSYFDAVNFCAWLTEKEHGEKLLPAGWAYRLPTDEEWSQACGSTRYPWGDAAPPGGIKGNYAGEESRLSATDVDAWNNIKGYRDAFPRTAPVGSFPPNSYGLYDMGGNVWQWCDTWYRAEMNDEETKKEWPKARNDKGGTEYRVGRGGAWSTRHETRLRTQYRDFAVPLYRDDSTGFRCVLSPVSP